MGTSYSILIHANEDTWVDDDHTHGKPSPAIDFLNADRLECGHYGLFEIVEPSDPALGYGENYSGTGHFAATGKNMHVERFKARIDEAPWNIPSDVVVLISEDCGDTIEIYRPGQRLEATSSSSRRRL